MAVRELLGDQIKLVPAKGGGHLVAHLEFQRAALLGGAVGTDGSGDPIWHLFSSPEGPNQTDLVVNEPLLDLRMPPSARSADV